MRAVEGRAPQRRPTDGALVPEGELDAVVPHLADVQDRRIGAPGRGRGAGIEQQVVRVAPIHVDGERPPALVELEVQADVRGPVFFPLQVRIPDLGNLESGRDRRFRSPADVVERVAPVAAELADDAVRRDLLVAGDPVAEPEHRAVEEPAAREERLVGQAPSHPDRRERAPMVRGPQP